MLLLLPCWLSLTVARSGGRRRWQRPKLEEGRTDRAAARGVPLVAPLPSVGGHGCRRFFLSSGSRLHGQLGQQHRRRRSRFSSAVRTSSSAARASPLPELAVAGAHPSYLPLLPAGGEAAWSRQGGGSPTMAEAPPRAGAAAAGAAQGSNGSVGSPVAGLVSGAVDFLLCFPHPKRIEVVLLRCAAAPAPSFAAPPSPSPRRRIGGERRGAARGEGPIAGASSRSYSCSGS
ncbi:unnamed protein product [Urochloa humidicola]